MLTRGEWTHDYGISFDEAKEMGLHVSSDLPPEFPTLLSLYPQPKRRRASVEYAPGRKGPRPAAPA